MQARNIVIRGSLIVLLLGGWLIWKASASSRPAWLNHSLAWTRAHLVPSDRTTTIVASVLLAGYLLVAAWWIAKSRRRRSYDDGLAIFCALVLAGIVALAAGVLALGWYFGSSLTIQWTGACIVFPSIQIVIGLIAALGRRPFGTTRMGHRPRRSINSFFTTENTENTEGTEVEKSERD